MRFTLFTSFLLSFVFFPFAHAEQLDVTKATPYSVYQNATESEKAQILESFQTWAKDSYWTEDQAKALVSLVSENPEVSGPDLLESLDQDLLDWFYGLDSSETESLVHRVGLISSTPNETTCRKYTLCVVVNISKQRLYAYYNGSTLAGVHDKPVSTARKGKVTPTGLFSVDEIAGKNRRSGIYNGAYMGYAMQFKGNYFIHATSTDNYSKLGSRASAGCVRVRLDVAEKLNGLMRKVGRSNIRVVVKY